MLLYLEGCGRIFWTSITILYQVSAILFYLNLPTNGILVLLGRLRGLEKREVKQKLDEWLEKFQIQEWKKKRIEQLSKGMAQKVQFICTIVDG